MEITVLYELTMKLQGPFKEIELEASGQDKNDQTLIIAPPNSLLMPLPHFEQPGLPLLGQVCDPLLPQPL